MPARGDGYVGAGGAHASPGGRPWRRVRAEARWARQRFTETRDRRSLIPHLETPTRTPDRYRDVRVTKDVRIPMRDGVTLAADVYSPHPAGRLPAVLIRMPYSKDRHYAMAARGSFWARKGYHCVIQDVRGRGRSGGRWEPLLTEAVDGWDTLDWLAARPWCDGNIGMTGESYYGMTQWAVAGLGHPNLRCIAPGHTACDLHAVVHPGGAFMHSTLGLWAYIMDTRRDHNPFRFDPWHLPLISTDSDAGNPSAQYRQYVEHWRRDAWADERRLLREDTDVAIPVLEWGGWFDVLLAGTLSDWEVLTHPARRGVRHPASRLMIGPTDHSFTTMETGSAGRIALGGDWWPFDRVQRFLDEWLRPEAATVPGGARSHPVEVYRVGAGRWASLSEWPPPDATPTNLYLRSGGRAGSVAGEGLLSLEAPEAEPEDHLIYDPDDPVTYWLGRDLWGAAGHLGDRSEVSSRADVLVYATAPLDRGLEVLGPVTVVLHASSTAPDTDLTAALVDVYPDGYAQLVQEGIIRARFRQGSDREVFLESGRVERFEIDLCAVSHTFGPGHRIRLEVSSSGFGRWDRNLNTAEALGKGRTPVVACNRVFHERGSLSYLVLPVVEGGV